MKESLPLYLLEKTKIVLEGFQIFGEENSSTGQVEPMTSVMESCRKLSEKVSDVHGLLLGDEDTEADNRINTENNPHVCSL